MKGQVSDKPVSYIKNVYSEKVMPQNETTRECNGAKNGFRQLNGRNWTDLEKRRSANSWRVFIFRDPLIDGTKETKESKSFRRYSEAPKDFVTNITI